MKNRVIILIVLNLGWLNYLISQDFHVSQFNETPLYLNPALTGVIADKNIDRASIMYRSQWGAITDKSFTSFAGAYDRKLGNRFAVGGFLMNNRSGIANINSFSFYSSGKYSIIENVSKHRLDIGLQLGVLNRSLRPENLTFESQYSSIDGEINPNLSSGEAFNQANITKFNANTGVFYEYNDNEKIKPYLGIAIHNLVMPNIAFFNEEDKLGLKTSVNLGVRYQINTDLILKPTVLYMTQAKATELILGLTGAYTMNSDIKLLAELYYRDKDAIIIGFGLVKDNIRAKASYDINTSYLSNYTNSKGAIEVSFVYIGLFNKMNNMTQTKSRHF